jgi:hypothetical protein
MKGTPKTAQPSALKHYLKLTLVVLVLAAGVCVAAYFQNEIKLFFKMKAWDKKAPANTVVQFLSAAKEGKPEATVNYVKAEALKPLQEKGQIVGYASTQKLGPPPQRFADLLPEGDIRVTAVLFLYTGQGAAAVDAPGKGGAPFSYTLDKTSSGWQILHIGPGSMGGARK